MIVSGLIFAIALLSIFQCNDRRMTALVFTLLTLQHDLFFQGLGGLYYFLSAGLTDIIIMVIIAKLRIITKLTMNLLNICLGFILLNSVAWIMWELSLPYENIYALVAAILYFCAIVSLLSRDGIENGNYRNYRFNEWFNNFRMPNFPRVFSRVKL